jgi:branched-chain amino acid aminotransferase
MPTMAFRDGDFVPQDEIAIGIQSHVLHYGTNVFEGIRAYWNGPDAQLHLFRADRHYARLHNSARFFGMKLPYSVDELCAISASLLATNEMHEDVYLRPILFKSSSGIGVWREKLEDSFVIFHVPMGQFLNDGLRCSVSSWRRPEGNAAPARAKVGGMYAAMALARHEAMLHGFDEAIMLSSDGHVAEGTGENIVLVQDGRLVTPAAGDDILAGITRECLIELAKSELGLTVVERAVNRSELYMSDEIFMCGTAAEVTPVIEVDHRCVGDASTGPITAALRELLSSVVRGKHEGYRAWLRPVYTNGGSK